MDSEILDSHLSNTNAGISDAAKGFLAEIAKWAKFLSILGFIGAGFMVLIGLFFGTFMGAMSGMADDPAMAMFPTTIFSVIYIAMAALIIIPTLYHYRFATKTQQALRSNDENLLTEALGNLKSYYKFYGIMMAIIMGFYALAFVLGGLGAAFM